MSNHSSLPGFDAWLTHNPADDMPDPSAEDYRRAVEELGMDANEEKVWDRAYEVMEERILAERDEELLNQYAGRLADRMDDEGDGPY